jgi:hypothetical protein
MTAATRQRGARSRRQPLMPEAAANPATVTPNRSVTLPVQSRLYDGHLTAECSIRLNGAPACPACLGRELRQRLG